MDSLVGQLICIIFFHISVLRGVFLSVQMRTGSGHVRMNNPSKDYVSAMIYGSI